ncbi:poly(beta-D-mannuronate) lyase [Albidovulum inexpectatum]|uniref:Poly(Beta-D-mannuronate) lyase n=1 Tax=Albidovulum inexpectatum TaxID=196587 RepID=A0A2S5JH62_9RHOB|nr:polysaccharide lyase family 7 protein [Albidovulum inexpectatum]PPB80813.1 poly(beta-D-mannuronate) lyase [Albidovulum inexpectatum]
MFITSPRAVPYLVTSCAIAVGLTAGQAAAQECSNVSPLKIVAATDDGSFDKEYGPARAIDGSFDNDSRWSSKGEKVLELDLGEPQLVKEIGLAFYKGNERRSRFRVEASVDGTTYAPILEEAISSGNSTAIERFDVADTNARFIRVVGLGNESSEWNSILEVHAYGCGSGELASIDDGSQQAITKNVSPFGLRTDVPPAKNFDLTHWKLTLPVDRDGNGKVDEIEENELQDFSDTEFFYTDPATGGMVFRVSTANGKTTPNSSYFRTELREMLRGGDETIATRNDDGTPNKNNWVLSTAPEEAKQLAGGVDGVMRARLAVNQVTRLGDSSKVGRVIIGQIHAKDDEPVRLYYRKLPQNSRGSIYFAHEPVGKDDVWVEMIGSRSDHAENPADGIALDEIFEYEIRTFSEQVDGTAHPILQVTITREDGSEVTAKYDMVDSGYSTMNDFMYFKAGAYSQNNSSPWPERDFDQVTFYELEVEHN